MNSEKYTLNWYDAYKGLQMFVITSVVVSVSGVVLQAGFDIFTINLVRGYKEDNFREDLRELYRSVLKKPKTFMFTDAHVVEEGFLELINNILTIGMVPALFPEEEKDGLA
jgi:dynein heavy chain